MTKYNTRFLNSHTFYFMRLQPYRRYQKPIYKIVVTNQNNRIVSTLGYYNPFKIKFRISYKKLPQPLFAGKVIAIDRINTLLWLRKGVIPSIFLSFLLHDMGLLKTQSSSVSNELQIFKKQINKILPILMDELV
jgi:ribosomal protein S16